MTPRQIELERLLAEEPFVRALARSLVSSEADDLVQQTWLRALERRPASAILQPRRWLGQIVRNLVTDRRRQRQRQLHRERQLPNQAPVPSSAQLLESEEVRRTMIAAVDALPTQQRTVVLMRYYDGLPPRRIAADLQLPVQTVWNRLHAGLSTLRQRLDKSADDRRAWLLPLVPFAVTPRSMPWSETLPVTPALGVLAMTMKTKVVTTLATLLVLTVAWFAWGSGIRPVQNPTEPSGKTMADLAGGGVIANKTDVRAEPDFEREQVRNPPPAITATTGELVVHVRYAKEPLAGAGLTVIVARKGGDHRVGSLRAITDSEGTVRFEHLPPGDFVARTTTRMTVNVAATIEAGATTACTLTLDGGVTLTGIVVDNHDVPVGGAIIETGLPSFGNNDAEQAAVAAADGTFSIRQNDPMILVGARAPHFAASKLQFVMSKRGATEHVRIVLATIGGSIEGQVVGPDGEPIQNAVVRVGEGNTDALAPNNQGCAPLPAQVRTDEFGRFRAIGVPSGEQPLMARTAQHAPWLGSCVVPAAGTSSVRIQLALGVTCRGTVRGPDNQPIVATVTTGDESGFGAFLTASLADGSYVLSGLPDSEFEIKANRYRIGKDSMKVRGAAGETIKCDLTLSLGLAIRGVVVDSEGMPVPYVQILREFDDGTGPGADISITNKLGEFLFADCPPNKRYKLIILARKYLPLTLHDVAADGKPLELRLQPDSRPRAHIRGRLLRPDGSGAIGESVVAGVRSPQMHRKATVDTEDGRFDFEVTAGSWWLRAEVRDHPLIEVWPRDIEPGEVWEVGTLQLTIGGTLVVEAKSEAELSYRILDLQNRFVTGLLSPEPPLRSRLLAPGAYLLTVQGKGVAAHTMPFVIRSDAETKLTVNPSQGVRQRLVFAARSTEKLAYSVPFLLRQGERLVARDTARKPTNGEYSHAAWLPPGVYELSTVGGGLSGRATFTVGEQEGAVVRVPLR